MQLAEHLDVPLRDRNVLLLAAGSAPAFAQRDLGAPEMGPVRDLIERLLRGHEPYPALFALEVTVSELAIESFFPADEATAHFLRASSERA